MWDEETKHADAIDAATTAVIIALRPLQGKGAEYDTDSLIRKALRNALNEMKVDGLSGCRLCCN